MYNNQDQLSAIAFLQDKGLILRREEAGNKTPKYGNDPFWFECGPVYHVNPKREESHFFPLTTENYFVINARFLSAVFGHGTDPILSPITTGATGSQQDSPPTVPEVHVLYRHHIITRINMEIRARDNSDCCFSDLESLVYLIVNERWVEAQQWYTDHEADMEIGWGQIEFLEDEA